jgi:two-component system response regulator GlrR
MARSLLIVDDQTDILRILEREFRRRAEYTVATANTPTEAMAQLAKNKVDLVVSDVRLGPHNGFALLQEINVKHPGMGTMLMTAYRSPSYRQQAEALGVAYFLEKPFPVETLIAAVDRYFSERENVTQPVAAKTTETTEMNSMAHFRPHDLVQLFCLNGRSVRIMIEGVDGQGPSYLYIQKGRVLHAETPTARGEEAFHSIINRPDSPLSVQEWPQEVEPTIHLGWEHLLFESARLADTAREESYPVLDDPFADFWKIAQLPA